MLRQATAADFAFIRSQACRAEYRPFITDEDEAGLQAYLDAPDCEILIWEPAGRPAGFAIFCEIGHPSGRVELMRLALAEAGQGAGHENLRAQKAYVRAGFTLEARLRSHDHVPFLGRVIDTLLYGMLRAEWQALEPLPTRA
jgi:hypothetical protein